MQFCEGRGVFPKTSGRTNMTSPVMFLLNALRTNINTDGQEVNRAPKFATSATDFFNISHIRLLNGCSNLRVISMNSPMWDTFITHCLSTSG
jgi:hypothetical protein